jgi:pimeloyl-ACP methyl ester carboxylesterase
LRICQLFSRSRFSKNLVAVQASSIPRARLVVATGSGHDIPFQQPDLVIDAARQVVEAVRKPGVWASPVTSPVS